MVLRTVDRDRLALWRDYISVVVDQFGDLCQMYQLMNELNNPVYRFLSHDRVLEGIRLGAKIIRARHPRAEITVNVLCDLWRWRQDLNSCLERLANVIDIVGLDFYPETWAVSWRNPWKTINGDLHELIGRANSGQIPRVAVMETGYSTNIPSIRGELQQVSFYQKLGQVLDGVDKLGGGKSLAFVALYELCDDNSRAFIDPEAHFGLLTSGPGRRKAAFEEVQRLCRLLS
jgi:hypothetical protein